MELLQYFNQDNNLGTGIRQFFTLELNLNLRTPTEKALPKLQIFSGIEEDKLSDISSVYFGGKLSDKTFEEAGDETSFEETEKELAQQKYATILVFGVELNTPSPTRSRLAEITRWLNRKSLGAPVVVVFRYGSQLAFANGERTQYKHASKEGEKVGKVAVLRDITIETPHTGHLQILSQLKVTTTGKNKVDTFEKLYQFWQEVFSVSLLNKKFYQELSNWYFWAIKHVVFPGKPTAADAHEKGKELDELIQEHKATNVIRMLTRLLFVWFIKEKKLIPEALFDLKTLQKDILKNISPFHETGFYVEANKDSIYYKAILQNLFFATLNCPIEGDQFDTRKRGFRGDGYGTHRGIDWLMRYKKYFKDPDAFLKMVNQTVPFLNGGLFECLDDKTQNLYIDGFSDQMTKGEQLIVPDYLFFGTEEEEDLSKIVGITDKKYKQAAVKGLINILKSYKFTITENTPIEEDVALDPELLGKVFENLLASYNPETKTTARKQTGSFYTPREIVNYMVDESLIAYLKNAVSDWKGMDEETIDQELHALTSFDETVPFGVYSDLHREIINALSSCTILDPACGSGAFPMGILQKMVHILQKLDPENKVWKEVQLEKAEKESKAAFEIEDKQARGERLQEINEAFDQSINDPDYARKLFLIENCIYGVDIQPIATQISKLRFFISLVVEQKVNPEKSNFGIRPLPNLETKFVAANTLIGIDKPTNQTNLFDSQELKDLETRLKQVRSKLFGARTKETKLKYRELDKSLRDQIAIKLKSHGWQKASAEKLAGWDPYDQNASSSFFDPEWMFDVKDGFDLILGNPPYVSYYSGQAAKITKEEYKTYLSQYDFIENKKVKNRLGTVMMFLEKTHKSLSITGVFTYIIDLNIFSDAYIPIRKYLYNKISINELINNLSEFENVGSGQIIIRGTNYFSKNNKMIIYSDFSKNKMIKVPQSKVSKENNFSLKYSEHERILEEIKNDSERFEDSAIVISGMNIGGVKDYFLSETRIDTTFHKAIFSGNIFKYKIDYPNDIQNRNPRNNYIKFDKKLEKHIWDNNLGTPSIGADDSKFKQPKLLLRRPLTSDGTLAAAYSDDSDHYSDVTVYIINKLDIDLHFLLAIINSKLATFYCKQTGIIRADKGQQPQITINKFKEFPVRYNPNFNYPVCSISKILSQNKKVSKFLFDVIDGLIFNLYFPNHVKELGIDVLKFVERDIAVVIQGREFEGLSDPEKEAVIEQLHGLWSDPENEVVKRMGMFKERSPEILKVILES